MVSSTSHRCFGFLLSFPLLVAFEQQAHPLRAQSGLPVPTPLLAVKVIEYALPVPTAGVPESVPVPFPLSLKVTPLGSAPVSVSDGVGVPVVVTENVPAVPTVNVLLLALVITGAAFGLLTVSAKA